VDLDTDLTALARYWSDSYAIAISQTGPDGPPLVAVVGAVCDAIATTDMYGDTAEEQAAWLIGYFGYPCDAAYIAATMEVRGLDMDPADFVPFMESGAVEEHPEVRVGVLTWAHAVPTRQTVSILLIAHTNDDGSVEWHDVDITGDAAADTFAAWEAAAHEYEGYPINPADVEHRRVALSLIQDANGIGFDTHLHPSGSLLEVARNWRRP
jgi:hypothetical protein